MPAHPDTVSPADWVADLEHLKSELPGVHPNLFFHLPRERFEARVDELGRGVSRLTYTQIVMNLREIIAELGDPHTNLGFYELIEENGAYPLQFYEFSDGLHVVGANQANVDLLGAQIRAIGGTEIARVVDLVGAVEPRNEPHFAAKRMPYCIRSHLILRHYGFADEKAAVFEFSTADGRAIKRELRPIDQESSEHIWYEPSNTPFYWSGAKRSKLFRDELFTEDSVYFVQYNECWGREVEAEFGSAERAKALPSFTEFADRVVATIENTDVKLFFDVRFNGGGSSPQGTALVERIAGLDSVNRKGRIFVGISHETFSSAVMNVMDFRLKTEAILIGRPAGGRPNHYGEVRPFVLPNSKIAVYHSTKYFEYLKENVEAVMPDVYVDNPFSALASGVDPLYEYAKTYRV